MGTPTRFAVLGCGNGGMTLAGLIGFRGCPVTIWEGLGTSEKLRGLQTRRRIRLSGAIEGTGRIESATDDIGEAVRGASVILVVVPAFAHESVFERLIPHLRDGQRVVVIPGNFGAILLRNMMAGSRA